MNNLLTNREWKVSGNWYDPKHKLQEYSSVVKVELCDTTSSAGDWSGFFIQKIGRMFYFIPFNQENSYPRSGEYTLYTGNFATTWVDEYPEMQALYELWNDVFIEGF